MSAADPVRDVDCRESALPRSARFAPEFISFVRDFAAVRFLDWQNINANHTPSWEAMARPGRADQLGPEGASIELMVALANEADVDPWFLMPYNADDDYLRNFARYVHRHLEPGRVAYVELGNEVWNMGFKSARQAQEEGLAAGLHTNPFRARLRRYAQKSKHMFAIWSDAFRADPKRLVRIVATQPVCDFCFEEILDFEGTAGSVDALATAPYFAIKMKNYANSSLDEIFAALDKDIERAIGQAVARKAVADRYGKRLIAYEAGQHLVTPDVELNKKIQRDPRMGKLYSRYLAEWRKQVGDRMMLFSSTSAIGRHGAWGMREYSGQSEADAPKLAAVKAFMADLR